MIFRLTLLVTGRLKNEIVAAVKSSGIENRITLHGFRPYEYFLEMAYECDVFVQASRTSEQNHKKGTPMAIVDAMATGLAIISTKHSDIPEIVVDGERNCCSLHLHR